MVINMLNEEFLNEFFKRRIYHIEENINVEYHKRIKQIKETDKEERENIKMAIMSELYYKQGIIDGINFMLKNFKKNS